jgi:hypothetical protein
MRSKGAGLGMRRERMGMGWGMRWLYISHYFSHTYGMGCDGQYQGVE